MNINGFVICKTYIVQSTDNMGFTNLHLGRHREAVSNSFILEREKIYADMCKPH